MNLKKVAETAISQDMEKRRREKEELKDKIRKEIEDKKKKLGNLNPFTFSISPLDLITNKYMTLYENKNYLLKKQEEYKDVKKPGKFEKVAYFVLEFFFGVWIIYFLIYRSLGSELFKEVTPTFHLNIDPLYISLVLEGIVVIMFSMAMKFMITSRFDEDKKQYVKTIFKFGLIISIISFLGFIWLSSI